MLIAAVDTSTLTLSCALLEIGQSTARVIAERSEQAPAKGAVGGHSGRLPAVLVEMLAAGGKGLEDVEGYAVGIGPGSFTGLRIGLATWKALAYAQRRPIAGVSGLAALALATAPLAPKKALLVPLLDAKRGEVYAGFFRATPSGGIEQVAPEAALGPDALVAYLCGGAIVQARLGDAGMAPAAGATNCALATSDGRAEGDVVFGFGQGWSVYQAQLAQVLCPLQGGPETPSAVAIGQLAAPTLIGAAFDLDRLSALEPHYVRPSEAELRFPGGLRP